MENYLPQDLINIINEYECTKFDRVISEYKSILGETFIIRTNSNIGCNEIFDYPRNYNYAFECDPKLYPLLIFCLKIKIKEKYPITGTKELKKLQNILYARLST